MFPFCMYVCVCVCVNEHSVLSLRYILSRKLYMKSIIEPKSRYVCKSMQS